jgi:hypothetical protein
MGNDYREGSDPVTKAQAKAETNVVDKNAAQPANVEGFEAKGGSVNKEALPDPEGDSDPNRKRPDATAPIDNAKDQGEEAYTAVLLIQMHNGTVIPVTNLKDMNLHHLATPHEVMRMAMDVSDQISSVRTIGEILRNTGLMLDAGFVKNAAGAFRADNKQR